MGFIAAKPQQAAHAHTVLTVVHRHHFQNMSQGQIAGSSLNEFF
jgi:hypothetical protein